MRISDWSSDVCSSDLPVDPRLDKPAGGYYWQVSAHEGALRSRSLWDAALPVPADVPADGWLMRRAPGPFGKQVAVLERKLGFDYDHATVGVPGDQATAPPRQEMARVGKEGGRRGRYRGSQEDK